MPVTAADLQRLVASFPWDDWTTTHYGPGYESIYRGLVKRSGAATTKALDGTWDAKDPFTSTFMTTYVGERITSLEATTKERVSRLVRQVLNDGQALSSVELGKLIQSTVSDAFDEMARWRANMIARTEVAIAVNHGTVLGSAQGGYGSVDVFDGDDDEECAAANGQVWAISEALGNPVAHPNCVRAFAPHVEE